MLAASPEPGAEEWAIHDYEGFGEMRLSEWESFERVSAIAAGIAEHGAAFARGFHTTPAATFRTCGVRGRIQWRMGFASRICRGLRRVDGMYDAAEKSGSSYVVVDIDMLTRDLDIELYTVESDRYTVYVFDPSV